MTIAGLKYGPYFGAPTPSPYANVGVGFSTPSFISLEATWGIPALAASLASQYLGTIDLVEDIPSVGDGDDSTPVIVVEAEPESPEVCWVDTADGTIACFLRDSIFQPGGVWGPAGNWVLEGEYHPPPINPEYLPERRVEEPAESEEENMAVDWGTIAYNAASTVLGGVLGVSPTLPSLTTPFVAPGAPPPVINPAVAVGAPAMIGACPTRKTRTLTIDCATGQEVKRTRRRRRRLLTSGDLGDLAQLQALVGKGSNAMSVAVSKAIR